VCVCDLLLFSHEALGVWALGVCVCVCVCVCDLLIILPEALGVCV